MYAALRTFMMGSVYGILLIRFITYLQDPTEKKYVHASAWFCMHFVDAHCFLLFVWERGVGWGRGIPWNPLQNSFIGSSKIMDPNGSYMILCLSHLFRCHAGEDVWQPSGQLQSYQQMRLGKLRPLRKAWYITTTAYNSQWMLTNANYIQLQYCKRTCAWRTATLICLHLFDLVGFRFAWGIVGHGHPLSCIHFSSMAWDIHVDCARQWCQQTLVRSQQMTRRLG